jgi:hypothetical protein
MSLRVARAASVGHCPHHRRANYKMLFRDVRLHIIFIMIALTLQNLTQLFNAYLIPTHLAVQQRATAPSRVTTHKDTDVKATRTFTCEETEHSRETHH